MFGVSVPGTWAMLYRPAEPRATMAMERADSREKWLEGRRLTGLRSVVVMMETS